MLGLVESLFGRLPPFTAPRLMATSLRMCGLRIGVTSSFWGMPTFTGGPDCLSRLSIGESCGFNFGCQFELDATITIADHVSVGHEVLFLTRTFDVTNPACRATPNGAKPIVIEAGAWLGARVVVFPGVTIGAGSVVAANTIVRQDISPNVLVTGNRKISIAKWR